MLETLGVGSVVKTLFGDSKSALHLAATESGNWRTRHLRIRHARLREALRQDHPTWTARHMPGAALLADGLTKPLQGQKFVDYVKGLKFNLDDKSVLADKVTVDGDDKTALDDKTTAIMADELTRSERVARAATLMTAGAALTQLRDQPEKVTVAGVALVLAGTKMIVKEKENELSSVGPSVRAVRAPA